MVPSACLCCSWWERGDARCRRPRHKTAAEPTIWRGFGLGMQQCEAVFVLVCACGLCPTRHLHRNAQNNTAPGFQGNAIYLDNVPVGARICGMIEQASVYNLVRVCVCVFMRALLHSRALPGAQTCSHTLHSRQAHAVQVALSVSSQGLAGSARYLPTPLRPRPNSLSLPHHSLRTVRQTAPTLPSSALNTRRVPTSSPSP